MNKERLVLVLMVAALLVILTLAAQLVIESIALTPPPDVDTTVKVVGSIQ